MSQNLPKLTPEMLIPRMGEYIVQKGLITEADLQRALTYQQDQIAKGNHYLLGQSLMDLNLLDRDTLDQVVTEQILQLRSALVPVANFSTQLAQFVLMAGIVMMAMAPKIGPAVFLLGIVLFSVTVLFTFITLPVEFDASRRALVWLENSGVASGREHAQARDALKWAALTYVVAALAALGQLLYYVMIFLRSRR